MREYLYEVCKYTEEGKNLFMIFPLGLQNVNAPGSLAKSEKDCLLIRRRKLLGVLVFRLDLSFCAVMCC